MNSNGERARSSQLDERGRTLSREQLEAALVQKEALTRELKGRVEVLEKDDYNYSLIEERDQELAQLEDILRELRGTLREKDEEISELKSSLAQAN
jgi:hypothetical protein